MSGKLGRAGQACVGADQTRNHAHTASRNKGAADRRTLGKERCERDKKACQAQPAREIEYDDETIQGGLVEGRRELYGS